MRTSTPPTVKKVLIEDLRVGVRVIDPYSVFDRLHGGLRIVRLGPITKQGRRRLYFDAEDLKIYSQRPSSVLVTSHVWAVDRRLGY